MKDILSLPKGIISRSKLKRDPKKKGTFNYYYPRKGVSGEFIKVSVLIDRKDPKKAFVKTIFITKVLK